MRTLGSIITFYSYKGGVGRTMALANTAATLATRGYRVLMIDWDLEAPGLHCYFDSGEGTDKSRRGLLHLITEPGPEKKWAEYCVPCLSGGLTLDLLPSGIGVDGYESTLLDFDWVEFYTAKHGDLALEAVRNDWAQNYDFVLIDSRTGLTDSSGICTAFMPDILVLVVTANAQSLSGTKHVIVKSEEARQRLRFSRSPLTFVPLISRWDGREEQRESETWLERIQETFKDSVSEWFPLGRNQSEVFTALRIPHVAYFSFGEKLPVLTHSVTDPDLPGFYFGKLSDVLEKLANPDAELDDILAKPTNKSSVRKVLISCVSSELGSYSRVVDEVLRKRGIEVLSVESNLTSNQPVAELAKEVLSKADALLVLLGNSYGPSYNNDLGSSCVQQHIEWANHLSLPIFCFALSDSESIHSETKSSQEPVDTNQRNFRSALARTRTVNNFADVTELRLLVESIPLDPHGDICWLPFPSLKSEFAREAELPALREEYLTFLKKNPKDSNRSFTQAILGPAGIGKTCTAIEYAWRYRNDYSAVMFVAASSAETFANSLAFLAGPEVLNLPLSSGSNVVEKIAAVEAWLQSHQGWLLCIDDVADRETQRDVLGFASIFRSGHILITSRLVEGWRYADATLALTELTVECATDLFKKLLAGRQRRTEDDETESRELVISLGRQPLAIDLASTFIGTHRIRLKEFNERLAKLDPKIIDWKFLKGDSVPISFRSQFMHMLGRLNNSALGLLKLLCWLAPDSIPRDLLECIPDTDSLRRDDVESALAELAINSVVQWDRDGETFQINRITLAAMRASIPANKSNEPIALAVRMLLSYIKRETQHDPMLREQVLIPILPHAAAIISHAGKEAPDRDITDDWAILDLVIEIAQFYRGRGEFSDAEDCLAVAKSILMNCDDKESGQFSQLGLSAWRIRYVKAFLASIQLTTNRVAESELTLQPYGYKEDFKSLHGSLRGGVNHDLHMLKFDNLSPVTFFAIQRGMVLQSLGDHRAAEHSFRQSVEYDEEIFGEGSWEVACNLNLLAQSLICGGSFEEAGRLIRKGLAIAEVRWGSSHGHVAPFLNNLSLLLFLQNAADKATATILRALDIERKQFGGSRLNTAVRLNNCGRIFQSTPDREPEAIQLLRESVDIFDRHLDPMHPNAAVAVANLAVSEMSAGLFDAAALHLKQALTINEKFFGGRSFEVVANLACLGRLYKTTGDELQSNECLNRAATIFELRATEMVPLVMRDLGSSSLLLKHLQFDVDMRPVLRRVIEAFCRFTKATGQPHPKLTHVVVLYQSILSRLGISSDEQRLDLEAVGYQAEWSRADV